MCCLSQAYSSSVPNADNRDTITWARFEYADVNDSAFFPDYNEGSSIPPLLLVLGYTTGVQVRNPPERLFCGAKRACTACTNVLCVIN